MNSFDVAAVLLVLAAVIGVVNDRWLRLPGPIALLIGALLSATLVLTMDRLLLHRGTASYWAQRIAAADLQHVLLDGVLPLLLFAGTMQVDARAVRDRAAIVVVLATAGVFLATGLFAGGFYALARLFGVAVPLAWCMVLGAILAPTDAVVVEQLLRQVRLPPSMRGIITGESLFNDGASVVVFLAAVAIAGGARDVVGDGRLALAVAVAGLGGIALGWLAGLLAAWASRRLTERTLEVTLSLALALASYRAAVAFGVSGPIAVVTAGLAYRFPPRWIGANAESRQDVAQSWAVIDDIANTLLFLLMGFQLLALTNMRGDPHAAATDAPAGARAGGRGTHLDRPARRHLGSAGADPAGFAMARPAVDRQLWHRRAVHRGAGLLMLPVLRVLYDVSVKE
jgi:CPA1 family monovalent cation:H+ antiporter